MHATRLSILVTALAAACSSSSPEPQPLGARPKVELPDLIVSGSCLRVEDTLKLAIAVANRGHAAAAPSATRVEFDADPAADFVRRTRFIAAHAFDTFEIEMPAACTKMGCRWTVSTDSANQVPESDEANNTFAGRC